MPGEGFVSQMLSSLKNNASLRKNFRNNAQHQKISRLQNNTEIETGPSKEAVEKHLKESRSNEKSENIKSSLVLIFFLLLIIAAIYGVITSLNNLNEVR
jgi:hypothetical protein